MGYGKSILLSVRVLALIVAMGVLGLGAWCKCSSLNQEHGKMVLIISISPVHHSRYEESWYRDHGRASTRGSNGGVLERILCYGLQRRHQDLDLSRGSTLSSH